MKSGKSFIMSAGFAVLMVASLIAFPSCGGPAKYNIRSGPAMSPDQVAILEEEIPKSGRSWIILIDEEDVHGKSINFWQWKGNTRSFELPPGVHTVVTTSFDMPRVQDNSKPRNSAIYETYVYSPVQLMFIAEKGHKYFITGEIDNHKRWKTWIKDAASNAVVSKVSLPDKRDADVIGKKCRIERRYIVSSISKDNVLYFPLDILRSKILSASDVRNHPVGKVLIDTIYKTMESGRLQYRKAYIVDVDNLLNKRYVLVPREGLTPDDSIPDAELYNNYP